MAVTRIDSQQAQADIQTGALLVCAYDDPAKFKQYCVNGAISMDDFKRQLASLPKNREIIFYCG
jgi:rhodanese-related sulfurtransferase